MRYSYVDTEAEPHGGIMNRKREDSIYRQREALTQILRDPLERVAHDCVPLWKTNHNLENILLINFSRIPYCAGIYALDTDGRQITENVCRNGIQSGHRGCDRSQRPYMKKVVPAWGFLLSDVYTSQAQQLPLFTAIHIVRNGSTVFGYLGADFDLRDLPLTSG